MKTFKPIYFFAISLLMINCTKEEPIMVNTEEDHKMALETMANHFLEETGIIILYEPGLIENQEDIELSHGIQESDYLGGEQKYQKLRYRIQDFIDYMNVYPQLFIEEAKVKYIAIVFSSAIRYAGQAHNFTRSVALNGLGSSYKGTLCHELFHLFDPAPGNTVWSEEQLQFDNEWKSLNPPNFTYGNGCGSNTSINSYTKGFLSEYSRCSSIEDRAVTFQMLLHKRNKVGQLVESDPFLDAKVNFIKTLVNDFGYEL